MHFLAQQEMSVKDNYSEGLVLEGLLLILDIFNGLAVRKCFLVDLVALSIFQYPEML